MSSPPTIAYRPDLARLPDSKGKPIGHSAALLLSQFLWLRNARPIAGGWIEVTREEIVGWGFTRTEQETCRRVLRAAGYIEEKRSGEHGRMQFLVCAAVPVQTAENLPSESDRRQETYHLAFQMAENLPSGKNSDGGKPTIQTAENLPSEGVPPSSPPSLSLPDPLTHFPPIIPPEQGKRGKEEEVSAKKSRRLSREEPPEFTAFYTAYPRKEARLKACQAWLKINPDAATVEQIMTGLKRALPHLLQTGLEYRPHPATWLNNRRWEDESVSVGFSKPVPKNGHSPPKQTHEERLQEERDALAQIAARRGVEYG